MGGSALPAEVITNWLDLSFPFYINKGYHLPPQTNKKTLAICCSYSGNTEEFSQPHIKIDLKLTEKREASYPLIRKGDRYLVKLPGYELVYAVQGSSIEDIIGTVVKKLKAVK